LKSAQWASEAPAEYEANLAKKDTKKEDVRKQEIGTLSAYCTEQKGAFSPYRVRATQRKMN